MRKYSIFISDAENGAFDFVLKMEGEIIYGCTDDRRLGLEKVTAALARHWQAWPID